MLEIRVDFTLPWLWSLRGQQLAKETRCFDDGNTDMPGSISERMTMAAIDFFAVGLKLADVCETLAQLNSLLRGNCLINDGLYIGNETFGNSLIFKKNCVA